MALLTTLDKPIVAYYDPNDGSLYLLSRVGYYISLNSLQISSASSNLRFSNFRDQYPGADIRQKDSKTILLKEASIGSSFFTLNIWSTVDLGQILIINKDQTYLNEDITINIRANNTEYTIPIIKWPAIVLPNESIRTLGKPSDLVLVYDSASGGLKLANNLNYYMGIELIDLYSPTGSFLGGTDINIYKNKILFSPTGTPWAGAPIDQYWYYASKNELYASSYNTTLTNFVTVSYGSFLDFDSTVMKFNNIGGTNGLYLPKNLSIEQLKLMIGTNPVLDPAKKSIRSQFLYRFIEDPRDTIRRGYVVDSRVPYSSFDSVYGTVDFLTTSTPTPTISKTPPETPCVNTSNPLSCDNFYVPANNPEWQDTGIAYDVNDIVYFTVTGCVNFFGSNSNNYNVDSLKPRSAGILKGRIKYPNGTYSTVFDIYSSDTTVNFGGGVSGRIELRIADEFIGSTPYGDNLGGFCVCVKKSPTGPCLANNTDFYPRPSRTPTNTPTPTFTSTPTNTRTNTPTQTPTPTSTRCVFSNNLIKNSGFENGNTDWQFNNANLITKNNSPLYFTNVSDGGSSIVSLLSQYNGCVSQEFATNPGSSYIIRFKYSAETIKTETQIEYLFRKLTVNIGDSGTASGQCLITNGINKDFIFDNRIIPNHIVEGTTNGINNTNVVWLDGVLVFNATSPRSRIVFQDTTASSNPERFSNTGILLDSISICGTPNETKTPTPTKSSTPTFTPTVSPTNTVTPTITPTFYKNSSLKIKHYLGVNKKQTLYSWGENNKGQLGHGDTIPRSLPTIFNVPNWKKIITNPYFDTVSPDETISNVWYGIKTNNTLWEWRETEILNPQVGNRAPELLFMTNNIGNFVFKNNSSIYFINSDNKKLYTYDLIKKIKSKQPIINEEITDIVSISPNFFAVLYAGETDLLISIGNDDSFLKFNKDEYKQIAGNGNGSLFAIKNDGTIWSMGSNDYGQLGNNSTSYVQFPTKISNKTWKYISSGPNHTLAIDTEGQVYGWGYNAYGQLGDGTGKQSLVPRIASNLPSLDWISVYAGSSYSLAKKDNKSLYGWGRNNEYMLGIGNNFDTLTPVAVIGTWDDISIYSNSIFALGEPPPSPTPTPSLTPTKTSTPTQTATPTQSSTATSTPTPTNTATPTLTASSTITPTATNTATPTTTQTPTQSQTATVSPTVTNTETPTSTPTSSATPTNTVTNSSTPTNTATNTPTPTASPTPTNTATPTNTTTPSLTPSQSPTPTKTPTTTPTVTNTQTPTNTATPTISITPSNTITSTPTPSYPLNGAYYYVSENVNKSCETSSNSTNYIYVYNLDNYLSIGEVLYKDVVSSIPWLFTDILSLFSLPLETVYLSLRQVGTTKTLMISRDTGGEYAIIIGMLDVCPTPTPTTTITPSNSPTPTNTASNSATPTPSITASNTPSVSLTSSITPTPTNTSSPTNTCSNTPTSSATPTNTSTNTPTPTLTPAFIYKSINMNMFRVIAGNKYKVELTTDNIGLARVIPENIEFMATSDPQRISCRIGFAANLASVMLHVKLINLNTGLLEYNSVTIKCNDILDCY